MFLDLAFANTGTPADAIQQRFTTLVVGLVITVGGSAIAYKGLQHMNDEGGGHLSGKSIGSMGGGAILAGGGFPLSSWLLGAVSGATGAPEVTSVMGDLLGQLLNPVGPLTVALTYAYYRARYGHGR